MRSLLISTVGAFTLLACGAADKTGTLYVTSIEITNVPNDQVLAQDLEVEVYLAERVSSSPADDIAIACAGTRTGLDHVIRDNTRYDAEAYFIAIQARPNNESVDRTRVVLDDLVGRDLYVIVVEDDDEGCPAAPTSGLQSVGSGGSNRDDLVGISQTLDTGALGGAPLKLDFDDVVELELDIARTNN